MLTKKTPMSTSVLAVFAALIAWSSWFATAYAAWAASPTVEVLYVRTNGNGNGLEIQFSGGASVCGAGGTDYAWIGVGETYNGRTISLQGVQNVQSIAMAALLSGRTVRAYTTLGADNVCRLGELQLN